METSEGYGRSAHPIARLEIRFVPFMRFVVNHGLAPADDEACRAG